MVLIRVEIIERNVINYRSSGRNQTYAFAMPVQCSYSYKRRRNLMCIKGGNACELCHKINLDDI